MSLKPLFPWVGGKRNEIRKYIKHVPTDIDTYIEPFVGGGATFFYLNHHKNIINDVHTELIDFYQCVKNDEMNEIHTFMSDREFNEASYFHVRDDMEIISQLDNAKRFYFLRKTCFRGIVRYDKKGVFNVRYNHNNDVKFNDLQNEQYVDWLKKTSVFNVGFEAFFETYNDPKNFMFLDPPYDCKITDYGFSQFGKTEHHKLAECFKTTSIRCLMVIGKTEFISELYAGYIVEEYDKRYIFNKGEHKRNNSAIHLIIKNYR